MNTESKILQFEDLHLLPGHKLQLAIDGYANERDRSMLLGYRVGHSIMLTTPIVNGMPLAFKVGVGLTVRGFAENMGCAYAFRSAVTHVSRAPYPHLHISVPTELTLGEVRSTMRAKVSLPARFISDESQKEYAILLQDVSLGGAGVAAKSLPVLQGETAKIHTTLPINGLQRNIVIPCVVRSINTQTRAVLAGLQFQNLSDDENLILYAYVLGNMSVSA